jgi:hypothetical protein
MSTVSVIDKEHEHEIEQSADIWREIGEQIHKEGFWERHYKITMLLAMGIELTFLIGIFTIDVLTYLR